MKLYKTLLLILSILAAGASAWGYTAADFAGESSFLLSNQNCLMRDLLAGYAVMKNCLPLMDKEEGLDCSLDISMGGAVSPAYAYRLPGTNLRLFNDFTNIYGGNGETVMAPEVGLEVSFPFSLVCGLDASWMPAVAVGNSTFSSLKLSANAYYRLLKEDFSDVGLLIGGGYSYLTGKNAHNISASYSDSPSNNVTYSGTLSSTFNYHAASLEVFVYKTLFILNFYGRMNYNWLFGSVMSELNGQYSGTAGDYTRSDGSSLNGLVLSAGMEVALGWFKINCEAGRNWLTSSVYGNAGVRFEL